MRGVVRIAGVDLDGNLRLERALWKVKGISHRLAKVIAYKFSDKTGLSYNVKLGEIDPKYDGLLEDIIFNPGKYGIPSWLLNRRKDLETGKDMHVVGADLDFTLKRDKEFLEKIKSYRGIRLALGLPVRGQKTKSHFRKHKISVVGSKKK